MLSNLNNGNQKLSKLLEGVESIIGDIADKRVDMEEIIDGMIKDCNTVKRALEDLCFEE